MAVRRHERPAGPREYEPVSLWDLEGSFLSFFFFSFSVPLSLYLLILSREYTSEKTTQSKKERRRWKELAGSWTIDVKSDRQGGGGGGGEQDRLCKKEPQDFSERTGSCRERKRALWRTRMSIERGLTWDRRRRSCKCSRYVRCILYDQTTAATAASHYMYYYHHYTVRQSVRQPHSMHGPGAAPCTLYIRLHEILHGVHSYMCIQSDTRTLNIISSKILFLRLSAVLVD